ncbi:hypothetical protein ACJJTC_008425 [Scirpophaga incertulas]
MDSANTNNGFFHNIINFPPIVNETINVNDFLCASDDLVSLIERLGKVFSPVKYDMQGNIDKIRSCMIVDDICLFEVMRNEVNNGKFNAVEGLMWLNRALLFFELIFHEIHKYLETSTLDINMTKVYSVAYEGSVKKYHNWVTQKLFTLICRMSPSLPQIMKYLEVDNDVDAFKSRLADYNMKLHVVRCKIEDFYLQNNFFKK